MSNINDFFNKGRQYEHSPMMHVQDQKPTGTDGGTSVVGDNQRDLNTVLTNEITGASLSGNAVTLPAGKYYVEARIPLYFGSFSNASVQDTSGNYLLQGGSLFSGIAANSSQVDIPLFGEITLGTTTELKVVMYVSSARTDSGFGNKSSNPNAPHEVYTDLRIWKLDAIKTSPILTESKLYPLPGNTYVTGNMYGLDYRKTGDHTISVDAGICMDSLNTTMLTGSALQTVTIGSTINEIYNLFLCDDGVVRTDTDVDGVTLLAGSVSKLRWIGFVKTNASGIITRFTMTGRTLFFETFSGVTFLTGISTTMLAVDESSIVPVSRIENITYGGQSNTNDTKVNLGDGVNSSRYGYIRTNAVQSDTYSPWAAGTNTNAQNDMQPIGQVKSVRMSSGIGKIAVRGVTMRR